MKTIEQQVEEKYPKEREEFKKMWNDGEFQWNYPPTFGASREASREVSLWRVWNTFIVPKLEERDRIAREEERESIVAMLEGRKEQIKGAFGNADLESGEQQGLTFALNVVENPNVRQSALTTPLKDKDTL